MPGPFFTRPNFEDRQVVQYTGSSITLSGNTNISPTGNFRIYKDAFPGLVATSLDADGTVGWGPISGISWSISACTSPLYVNNLVSCPLSAGTIQVDAGALTLNSELQFLISLSAGTNNDDILVIDNNGFVKSIPYVNGGSMWYVPFGYTLTVPDNYQSFVYGDLYVLGTIDLQTNAQLVVLNGNIILSGGSIIGSGTTQLVTLGGGGCCFTGGTGSCITDLYVTNIHGCSPLHIQPTNVPGNDVYIGENGTVNVGINIPNYTSPQAKLHIKADEYTGSTWSFRVSDSLFGDKFQIRDDGQINVVNTSSFNIDNTSTFSFAGRMYDNGNDVYMVNGGGNVGINVLSAITKLHVSGDTLVTGGNLWLTDVNTTIPAATFQGITVYQDYGIESTTYRNGILTVNTNPSGDTGIVMVNDSNVIGFMTLGGSLNNRNDVTLNGQDFYRNKLLIKAGATSEGMIINPQASNPSATLWWEIDGASNMILKGDGVSGSGNGFLGIALNPDGTEMPSSNLQVGGTGTTGTFQYRDGNQQNGYVLTSDADGNATWQVPTGGGGGGTFTGNTSASCITDLYLTNIYGCGNDVNIISTTNITGNTYINGTLYATSKSFSIPHPLDENKLLVYGSLEGPENGVYHRGKLIDYNIIQLPDYWSKLVDINTVTVNLTPNGKYQNLFVKEILEDKIIIDINNGWFGNEKINCFYTVYGERKDIDKLKVER